jgi:allantoicase
VTGCVGDPASASDWVELLPRARLQPDTPQWFAAVAGAPAVSHVRVDAYPDGGLARVRLLGNLTADAAAAAEERWRGSAGGR